MLLIPCWGHRAAQRELHWATSTVALPAVIGQCSAVASCICRAALLQALNLMLTGMLKSPLSNTSPIRILEYCLMGLRGLMSLMGLRADGATQGELHGHIGGLCRSLSGHAADGPVA